MIDGCLNKISKNMEEEMFCTRITLFIIIVFLSSNLSAMADNVCGAVPALPTTAEASENVAGQLKGEADFLSKLVGKAELTGQVEAARKRIYQSSDAFYAAQKDAYLSYIFCSVVMNDKSFSTKEKIEAIAKFRNPIRDSSQEKSNIPNDKSISLQGTNLKEYKLTGGQSVILTENNIVFSVIGNPIAGRGDLFGVRLDGKSTFLAVGQSVNILSTQGTCSMTLMEIVSRNNGRFLLRC